MDTFYKYKLIRRIVISKIQTCFYGVGKEFTESTIVDFRDIEIFVFICFHGDIVYIFPQKNIRLKPPEKQIFVIYGDLSTLHKNINF